MVVVVAFGGGGGCFFLACEDLGKILTIHSPPEFLFSSLSGAHAHLFHSLGQDQSTVALQAEMTVAECALMSCV